MRPWNALTALLVLAALLAAGCVAGPETPVNEGAPPATDSTPPADGTPPTTPTVTDWRDVSLKDVNTGQGFKISDFKGKVVILETMAVWCPLCAQQQAEIQNAEATLGPGVVSVSLDIDPNEDEAFLLAYVQRKGYGWRFAVAPPEVSRQLRDEFGASVLSPPSTPVIIIDKDGEPHLLRYGIKPADELVTEARKYQ
jgi:thiol-disulfide isomerase/thioredoxin